MATSHARGMVQVYPYVYIPYILIIRFASRISTHFRQSTSNCTLRPKPQTKIHKVLTTCMMLQMFRSTCHMQQTGTHHMHQKVLATCIRCRYNQVLVTCVRLQMKRSTRYVCKTLDVMMYLPYVSVGTN